MCLTCLSASVSCVLTCSSVNVPFMLTCSRANVSWILICLRANVPCVLPCKFKCSCADVSCVPTCLRAITSTNKNKFLMTFFFSFSCEIKLCTKSAGQAVMSLGRFSMRIQFSCTILHLTRRTPLTYIYVYVHIIYR